MNRSAIISALEAYRIQRGSGVSEPLRAVDVVGIADAIMEAVAQDEGAAGDEVAYFAKTLDKSPDEIRRALANLKAKGLIARPSPTPAADADRVRIAVQNGVARSMAADDQWKELSPPARAVLMLNVCRHVNEALAALKSTAAPE